MKGPCNSLCSSITVLSSLLPRTNTNSSRNGLVTMITELEYFQKKLLWSQYLQLFSSCDSGWVTSRIYHHCSCKCKFRFCSSHCTTFEIDHLRAARKLLATSTLLLIVEEDLGYFTNIVETYYCRCLYENTSYLSSSIRCDCLPTRTILLVFLCFFVWFPLSFSNLTSEWCSFHRVQVPVTNLHLYLAQTSVPRNWFNFCKELGCIKN